jgi:acetyl-CoA synthetase
MTDDVIPKTRRPGDPPPRQLEDYALAREALDPQDPPPGRPAAPAPGRFSWTARASLAGFPDGTINIGHEAVDRHALGPRANHLALRWLGRDGTVRDFTYRELSEASNRFANVLDELGVPPGDTVFVLAGRIPELYIAVLGALKRGCVVSPLFSAFGPEPIRTRMTIGEGRVLVTTTSLYRKKITPIRPDLPALKHVLSCTTSRTTSCRRTRWNSRR